MSENKSVEAKSPEWRKENSLTDPSDRDTENKWRPEQGFRELSNQEVSEAMKTLNNNDYLRKFPDIERRFIDPEVSFQKVGLFSFVPAKGATPNEKGFYGWAKLRGNYQTEMEANERAEFIIRNVDSYHQIYHTFVGRPFPLTVSSDYSKEVNRVDLRNDMTKDISSDVKSKREKEQREIEEIKKREEEIMERNKKILADPDYKEDSSDPTLELDTYITLRVKKAQLTWTYVETEKKLKEMAESIARTRYELEQLEEKNPEHKQTYFKKYMDAREQAGLDSARHQDNFIKFMVEDMQLPEAETEYQKIKEKEQRSKKE